MMRTILSVGVILLASVCASAQQWLTVIPNRAVYSLAVNPLNPRTVLAGNMARTLFRSSDGGATWEESAIQSAGGSSLITCLLIHPADTSIVFAGGVGFDGIDRSTDNGVTWSNVLRDPVGSRMEFVGESIQAHPTNPDTMYALRNAPGIVYRSTDRGATWDSLSTIPTTVGTDRFEAIAVAPDSTNIILVGGRVAFMYRSVDGGKTFVRGPRLTGHPDSEISLLRWSPSRPGTVYATVQYQLAQNVNNAGLYQSTDWGLTWKQIAHNNVSLYALEVFPGLTATDPDVIFVGGNQPPLSPAQIKGDSLAFKSIDGGVTWQEITGVPWTENELMEVNTNVWAFAKVRHQDVDAMMLASEAGVFLSTTLASVATGSAAASASGLSVRVQGDGSIILNKASAEGAASVHFLSVDGSLIATHDVTMHGGSVRLSPHHLPQGAYIVVLRDPSSTSSALMIRY